jgi:biopolymer transport protein ExbB
MYERLKRSRTENMLWIIVKGGPVMIPIILGSVLGLAIIIEKLWQLYAIRFDAAQFASEVVAEVRALRPDKAKRLCQSKAGYPVAATLKAGLERADMAAGDIDRAMERAGNSEIKSMERHLGGLISIIGIEPLLGFLGTITGLIRAFMAWERAGSNVTVSMLASGIYESMITTAAGLIIAVPYYLVCNFIVSKIKYLSYELNDASMQLAEAIAEAKTKK